MGIRVVAVDIGSVGPSSKFAWAAFDAPQRQVMAAGTNPQTAVWARAPGLLSGAGAALVLEMLDGSAPLTSNVRCAPQEPLNLLAAMALWAGMRIDPAELHAEVLVVGGALSRGPRAHECHAQADGCTCVAENRAHCRGMMRYNEPIRLSPPAADAPPPDHVRLAASAYLARFTALPVSTPDPTCAATCDGALTTAWTRWPPAARTWSGTSGGCKKPAGSSPPPSPGGSR
jgi:hypothetical protein